MIQELYNRFFTATINIVLLQYFKQQIIESSGPLEPLELFKKIVPIQAIATVSVTNSQGNYTQNNYNNNINSHSIPINKKKSNNDKHSSSQLLIDIFNVQLTISIGPTSAAFKSSFFYLHHIISYHIISYHIISYHIISCHIISYHINHIILYHIISYHIIYYHILLISFILSSGGHEKSKVDTVLHNKRYAATLCHLRNVRQLTVL